MTEVYSNFNLIAQSSVAGNNSHSFDEKMGVTYVGNDKEPSMLHGHIYGRGNPEGEYIQGVKLGGPKPGEIFDMRGQTPEVPGNNGKVKWHEGDMVKTAYHLREEVVKVKATYEKLGLNIVTK